MRIYRRSPSTAGRVIDGLAFVITPDDNKLHTLNGSATRLWTLAQKGMTVEEAAAELVATYSVDPETALRDAGACIDDLTARGILVSAA